MNVKFTRKLSGGKHEVGQTRNNINIVSINPIATSSFLKWALISWEIYFIMKFHSLYVCYNM